MWLYLSGAGVALLGIGALAHGFTLRGGAPEGVPGSERQRVLGSRWVMIGAGTMCAGGFTIAIGLLVEVLGYVFGPFIEPKRDLPILELGSRRLVAAIEAYEQTNGAPPARLEALVPAYVDEIPTIRFESHRFYHPSYHYEADRGGHWYLDVWIPRGFLDMDHDQRFQHEPDEARDRELGATLRIGEWVYIPD